MNLKLNLTSEQRAEIMRLTAIMKGSRTFEQLGSALGVHPSTLQPTVAYGRPPVLRHLLTWRLHSPDADVRRWAQAVLEVLGLLDENDKRE
jgi:hypothetical protein